MITYPIKFDNDVCIAFIDFDGVLNSNDLVLTDYYKNHPNKVDEFGQIFCPNAIENINEIVKQTGCKLVISSSWRGQGLFKLRQMWKQRKIEGEIIDITPFFDIENNKRYNYIPSCPRGLEIQWWLERNNFRHKYYNFNKNELQQCQIFSYVIIDDDNDMLLEQKNNFVKTNFFHGLTKLDAEKAIQILKTKIIPDIE